MGVGRKVVGGWMSGGVWGERCGGERCGGRGVGGRGKTFLRMLLLRERGRRKEERRKRIDTQGNIVSWVTHWNRQSSVESHSSLLLLLGQGQTTERNFITVE